MTVSLCETPKGFPCAYWRPRTVPLFPFSNEIFISFFFSPFSKTLHRTEESVYLSLCARRKGEWQQVACRVSSGQRTERCIYTTRKGQLWGARRSHSWQKSDKQREGTTQDLRMWQGRRAVLQPRLEGESHGWKRRTVRVSEAGLGSAPAIHVRCQWRNQPYRRYLNGSAFHFPNLSPLYCYKPWDQGHTSSEGNFKIFSANRESITLKKYVPIKTVLFWILINRIHLNACEVQPTNEDTFYPAWAFDGHCMMLKATIKNTVLSREQKAKKSIIYF